MKILIALFVLASLSSAKAQINEFVQDVSTLFPQKIQEQVIPHIQVEFKRLSKNFSMPSCGSKVDKKGKVAYGLAVGRKNRAGKYVVYLHEDFLPVIRSKREGRSYPCQHKTEKNLARATLIHEISHIADQILGISNSSDYRKHTANRVRILPLVSFIKLKNVRGHRSPDSYELKNDREHFAVNMEYALLDPEYACARPATYQLLKRFTGIDNKHTSECQTYPVILSEGGNRVKQLDPEKLYEIHYLEASSGKGIESKFGHSMLRLVFCRDKNRMGVNCRDDISEHVTVSYAANMTTTGLFKVLKGLFGKYQTNLFLIPFKETLKTYNNVEERELYSFPIKLSNSDKRQLLLKIVEEHWQYFGKYFFLTNNCATESARLLSTTESTDIRNTMTPPQLRRLLERGKMLLLDEAHTFESKKAARLQVSEQLKNCCSQVFDRLSSMSLYKDDLIEFVTGLTEEQRDEQLGALLLWTSYLEELRQSAANTVKQELFGKIVQAKGIRSLELKSYDLINYSYGIPHIESIVPYENELTLELKEELAVKLKATKEFEELEYYQKIKKQIIDLL